MTMGTATAQQTLPVERVIENIFDYISDELESEQEPDYEALYETLTHYAENPLNLNTVTKDKLNTLMFLSDEQAENLLYYIYRYGPMQSIYELRLVTKMDRFTIDLLLPFVTVEQTPDNDHWELLPLLKQGKHEITVRFDGTVEKKQGYTSISDEDLALHPNSRYTGDPFYTSLKYRFHAKDRIYAGLTAEKDGGEQFWGQNHKGYDAYSGYIQLNDLWKFSRIVVGDYRASFGQGLVMNGNYSTGRSGDVMNMMLRATGLTRKSSTDEYGFLRGIGATMAFKRWQITTFYSVRRMDADTTSGSFPSFKTDGLHRTALELERKNSLLQQVAGGNLSFRHRGIRVGITALHVRFNMPMIPADEPYKHYQFHGTQQSGLGIDYYVKLNRITLFGETAVNQAAGIATVNGCVFSPSSAVHFTVVQRYYSPKYDMIYARSFAKSNTNNESGVYLAAQFFPAGRWRLSASGDVYRYPWIRYNVNAPATGYDALLQLDFRASNTVEIYCRGRYGMSPYNYQTPLNPVAQLNLQQRTSVRFNVVCRYANVLLRSCVEANAVRQPETTNPDPVTGFLLFQDVVYTLPWLNMTIGLRYAMFDARDYANRFYVYERDVPLMMSVPMLYGVGSRWYATVGYKITQSMTCYLRFAQTVYSDDRTVIGSGTEQIDGNRKSDFRIYFRWKI
jgi:hypothetical protein